MSLTSRSVGVLRASVRSMLRRHLSQERRTRLKHLQSVTRRRMAPVLSALHGTFDTPQLLAELRRRLPQDFEILMVHSAFDTMLPMYRGTAKDLVAGLIDLCGPDRTLVMPSFVMGGRTYDIETYYKEKPFNVRITPSEMGLIAETFRRTRGVLRSVHPTSSVCALGPLAAEVTANHHLSSTGLSPDSPFGVMTRRPTAILGLGVEYFRCLTHVHTAAHAMGEEYPIRFSGRMINIGLVDYDGSRYDYQMGVSDKSMKLDLTVLWSLLTEDELREWRFHGVSLFVIPEARIVTERLIEAARRGITIFGKVPVESLAAAGVAMTKSGAA